ncbi:hypothetical protein FACS1894170_08770 [Planctomycetales bacterium]|nr:hypothetical protein FACS1894170_08770 [Planctomycetales bacterium]
MLDRIKELRRVAAKELKANPKNWRVHNARQRRYLKSVLDEIGYADALLARELADGSLQLIDGHLRAEITPNQEVPVLVLDVNENEANMLLATIDPLSAMADTDDNLFRQLAAQIETDNTALQELFTQTESEQPEIDELQLPVVWQIVVQCSGETEQQQLYERLCNEGCQCRIVNL